jgi:anthraniloyl-CoA monooxygenase
MKIVCIGGGPAGLYFALLMKQMNPAHEVTVVERNLPYDTFGWGVVFSDATMDNMRVWDPVTAAQIEQAFNHWDDIELLFKGRRIRSGGHGFVGIGRKHLLNIMQARCEQLGVSLVFETDVQSDEEYPDADLIIASDGVNSRIRGKYENTFRPDIVIRPNRYIWLGTNKVYEAFTFDFVRTEHGWFQAHIYKFDDKTSTFIVETTEECWKASGLDGANQEQSIAFCEKLFADNLQGERLMTNARHLRGSAWINFQRVVCDQWWLRNAKGSHVVLMGDAVHTAHFAIGSGTKLAIEDAIELARQFKKFGDDAAHIPEVLTAYQEARRVETLRLQNAAWNAMEWFEVCGQRYCDQLEPEQFMYSMLTRSQRISHENLRLRDAAWLDGYERWLAEKNGVATDGKAPPPCSCPTGCADSRSRTASWCRPWPSTRPWTVCQETITSCIWARVPWAGRGWCLPRWPASAPRGASRPAAPGLIRSSRSRHGSALPTGFMPIPTPSSPCRSAMRARRPRRGWPGKERICRWSKATGPSWLRRSSSICRA